MEITREEVNAWIDAANNGQFDLAMQIAPDKKAVVERHADYLVKKGDLSTAVRTSAFLLMTQNS